MTGSWCGDEAWRQEYDEERPKKGLGGPTPAVYGRQLTKNEYSPDSEGNCYSRRGDVATACVRVHLRILHVVIGEDHRLQNARLSPVRAPHYFFLWLQGHMPVRLCDRTEPSR